MKKHILSIFLLQVSAIHLFTYNQALLPVISCATKSIETSPQKSSHLELPRVFIVSFPKSGTHLAERAVQLLMNKAKDKRPKKIFKQDDSKLTCKPNVSNKSELAQEKKTGKKERNPNLYFGPDDLFNWVIEYRQENVDKVVPGTAFVRHAVCNQHNRDVTLSDKNIKTIFIIRDLRDVVVSSMHFWPQCGWNYFLPIFDADQLLNQFIVNYGAFFSASPPMVKYKTIAELFDNYIGWKDQPHVYTTFFEKLVGAKGGGSNDVQFQELENISKYLGLDLNKKEIEEVIQELFGHTWTFREGQIGSWKKNFNKMHKKSFKETAGQLLIDLGYEKDLIGNFKKNNISREKWLLNLSIKLYIGQNEYKEKNLYCDLF